MGFGGGGSSSASSSGRNMGDLCRRLASELARIKATTA